MEVIPILTRPDKTSFPVKLFAFSKFKLSMAVPGISAQIQRLKAKEFPFSSNLPKFFKDKIKIHGILGNDILPAFSSFQYESYKDGFFLRLSN